MMRGQRGGLMLLVGAGELVEVPEVQELEAEVEDVDVEDQEVVDLQGKNYAQNN